MSVQKKKSMSLRKNFLTQNLENKESLDYNINKTISFFDPTSYRCFDHFLKRTKLNSFALIFCRTTLEHPGTWTLKLGRNHTMKNVCVISFDGGLFLVVPCTSKCLSSRASLDDPLMHSDAKFDPSSYGFGMLNYVSLIDPNDVGFDLKCTLFDVLHDKFIGKYVEQCDYVLPFLGVFMSNVNDFTLHNQPETFDILPSIAKMTYSGKMVVTSAIRVQLRRFKIHWKSNSILDKLSKDTKNLFECFED
ncbi:hypothetical protein M9H77_07746 [Catharanthus roseus]|uniref:Uncharacterized protein n=1 Tax=Catharanthus roseus TaxID=4058 RepID=A0ACC0BW40_CATRO|nr:hypothetical protein M9H77_07746 [Catharanthus roseus]